MRTRGAVIHSERSESRDLHPKSPLFDRLAALGALLRRIIGAPDYDAYLAHLATHHPGMEPLSRDAFARDVLARRYERPGSRCC
jgi:uncharacterized short protein YbdD (DUF466 family)